MTVPAELEVELKLEIDLADLPAIVAMPALAGVTLAARQQRSTYFDTPRQALRGAGFSLRVRQIGTRRIQTVKAEGAAAAGLFARPEWERDIAGDIPELDAAAGPLATLFDQATLGRARRLFSIDVARRTGVVTLGEAEVEIMIDEGVIVAGHRTQPLTEIELELRRGPPSALFDLARAIDAVAPVRVGVLAKSERGYRMIDRRVDKAVKAQSNVVAAGVSTEQAFVATAGACIRQFRLNEAILVRTQDADALHQARVALRRLRSAFSIFKAVLGDERYEHLRTELRWIAATLGEARDIDVLLKRRGRLEPLVAARHAAYAGVLDALASPRLRGLMIDLSEWLATGGWRSDRGNAALRATPAEHFAATVLDKLRRRVKRGGRDLSALDDEERHDVRIQAKKLRYSTEFFVGLFRGKKASRRARAFLDALEALQERLGELNDLATEPLVLARLGLPPAPSPDTDRDGLLASAEDAHLAFADAKRFWR